MSTFWVDHDIIANVKQYAQVNPASFDVSVDSYRKQRLIWRIPILRYLYWELCNRPDITYTPHRDYFWQPEEHLDPLRPIIIWPNEFLLVSSYEYITIPEDCLGIISLKSTVAKCGLDHLKSLLFHPGFTGHITLELKNVTGWPIFLHEKQKITQMVIFERDGLPVKDYQKTGRYNNVIGVSTNL